MVKASTSMRRVLLLGLALALLVRADAGAGEAHLAGDIDDPLARRQQQQQQRRDGAAIVQQWVRPGNTRIGVKGSSPRIGLASAPGLVVVGEDTERQQLQRLVRRQDNGTSTSHNDGNGGGGDTASSTPVSSSSGGGDGSQSSSTGSPTRSQQSSSTEAGSQTQNTATLPSSTAQQSSPASQASETSTSSSTPPAIASSVATSSTPDQSTSSSTSSTAMVTSSGASSATSVQGPLTIIITTTASDGHTVTSASVSTPAASQTAGTGSSSSSSSKAWIIPLSVIGGLIGLVGVIFLGYRCTQRRFSDLDDDNGNAIRWPELLKRSEDETTILNPLGTHRRDGVAGIGDLDDDLDGQSDYNTISEKHQHLHAAGLVAPAIGVSRSASSAGSSGTQPPALTVTTAGEYPALPQHGYYDPYVGIGHRAPSPVLGGQAPIFDPVAYSHLQQQEQSPASPIYPPPPVMRRASSGTPSPPLGIAAGGTFSPASASGSSSPYMRSTSPGPNNALHPLSTHTGRPLSTSQEELANMQHTAPPLSPSLSQAQRYRLSVANPDDIERED